MVKFQINRSFVLDSKKIFFLCGSIISGKLKVGMIIKIWLDSHLFWVKPLIKINYLNDQEIAIGLNYNNSEELEWLNMMSPIGEMIDIVWEDDLI